MPTKVIKNNGNAGELSPYMDARTDHAKYYNGWSTASNTISLPCGGQVKRPGSEFIAKAKGACKLFEFEFSADDNMIIEAGNLYVRFFKDDERIMSDAETVADVTLTGTDPVSIEVTGHPYSTGDVIRFYSVVGISTELNYTFAEHNEYTITKTDANNFTLDDTDSSDFTAGTFTSGTCKSIYEVVTPYDAGEVFVIHIATSGDVIYIAHNSFEPRKIVRTEDNSWSISQVDFDPCPFLIENIVSDDYFDTICGTHTGSNGVAVLTDSTQSWTVDELIGYEIFNLTDGCHGTITGNTDTTITCSGGLSEGSGNDFNLNDEYVILEGYYIPEGLQVTLRATGHTPFVTTDDVHNGSRWQLSHTRKDNSIVDNPDNATNTAPTGLGIRIKGDLTFDVSNFAAGTDTVILWRKSGNGEWQEHRSFNAAAAYSYTEEVDDVFFAYTTSAGATTKESLTAKDQINKGIVEINSTEYTTSVAICTVKSPVFFDYNGYAATSNQTSMWAEGAWSEYRGYPRAVAFHEDRLWWAGTTNSPKTIWGSMTGRYENHTTGIAADNAINRSISEGDVSGIQWLMSHKSLVVGTTATEYMISATNMDEAITNDNIRVRFQSSYGSDSMQPVMFNNSIFFVQRNGRKMRVMRLNDYGDQLVSNDATLFANHIFELSSVDMAVQRVPDAIVWVVRNDGTLCPFVYEPDEDILSWTRNVTGTILDSPVDKYKSVAIKKGDTEDDIWVNVLRTINGTECYYIEKFSTRYIEQEDEAMMLDSAKIATGDYDSQDLILASDTIRCNNGLCNSSLCGGVPS